QIRHLAAPNDLHLDPNETYSFNIPEPERSGFEARHKKYTGLDKNLLLRVALVSFGDGTGWELGEPRDKRSKVEAGETSKKKATLSRVQSTKLPELMTHTKPMPHLQSKASAATMV